MSAQLALVRRPVALPRLVPAVVRARLADSAAHSERLAPTAHLVAAAALIAPLALAEYWSSALRAQGSVWTALVPRDILWRLATPVIVVLLFVAAIPLSGWQALVLAALVLIAALGLQALVAHRRSYAVAPALGGVVPYWRAHGTPTIWFLIGTVIDSAALNADIIFIGLLLSAESAGIYFNAFRTAGLLTLFMFAINLVLAPVFARHYHAGEMRKAQAISALTAWSGFVFSVAVFALFVLFGNEVLSLFGTPAGSGYWALVLLFATLCWLCLYGYGLLIGRIVANNIMSISQ